MANLDALSKEVGLQLTQLRDLARRGLLDIELLTRVDISLSQGVSLTSDALRNLTWLAVVNRSNWDRLQADGLRYTAFPACRAATIKLMRVGNRILFYVSGAGRIVASAEIVSRPRRVNLVWPSGVYPYRVDLKPEVVVHVNDGLKLSTQLDQLSFISNKVQWEGSVRSAVRLLPTLDFDRLSNVLSRLAERKNFVEHADSSPINA